MLGALPFFKKSELLRNDNFIDFGSKLNNERRINNTAVRPFMGHQRFGFQTLLNTNSPTPLPTAPAVVGGNVDWTKLKVTPATQYLQSVLSVGRPMNPPPALGSVLRLGEPNINSIHTTY
jgi:hypothetical protein